MTCAGAEALVEASDLYRGNFLAGLELRDAPAFEEWVLSQGEHLRRRQLQGLSTLVNYYTDRPSLSKRWPISNACCCWNPRMRKRTGARCCCWRRVSSVPPPSASTSSAAALQALDAEPDRATTAIYRQLRAGAIVATPDVMTPAEAAAYLKVRPADIQSLISSGQIKARQIGSDYRISKKVLDDFLAP